jgi:uncharacterized membrane protein YkoI
MTLSKRIYLAVGLAAVLAIAVAAITMSSRITSAFGDGDQPITGTALEKASAAALDHTGGGRVTGTEVGDEDSYYEVEVTLDDGSQVDVQLDKAFNVVDQMADHEGQDDGDGPNDQ